MRRCSDSLQKRTREEILDGFFSRFLQLSRARAREMRVHDARAVLAVRDLPVFAVPPEPALFFLIEYVKLLITKLCEFGAPPGAATDGLVTENRPDDPDFLPAV